MGFYIYYNFFSFLNCNQFYDAVECCVFFFLADRFSYQTPPNQDRQSPDLHLKIQVDIRQLCSVDMQLREQMVPPRTWIPKNLRGSQMKRQTRKERVQLRTHLPPTFFQAEYCRILWRVPAGHHALESCSWIMHFTLREKHWGVQKNEQRMCHLAPLSRWHRSGIRCRNIYSSMNVGCDFGWRGFINIQVMCQNCL